MSIIRRGLWTVQPQAPVAIDPKYRPAFLWNPQRGLLTPAIGLDLTATGTVTRGVGAKGVQATLGVNGYLSRTSYAPITTSDGSFTGDFTVFVVANPVSSSVGIRALVAQRLNSGGYNLFAMQTNCGAGGIATAGAMQFGTYATGWTDAVASGVVDGDYHVWAMRRQGTTITGWKDGVQVASTSGTVKSIGSASAAFGIGVSPPAYSTALTPSIVLAAGFNYAVGDMVELGRNIWSLFAPLPRRIWVPGAGAGGAITIDCTVGNATADGTKALLSLPITIDASVGNAVAAGTTATVTQAVTINTTLGNAVAAGVTAAIELGSDITVACSVGNAVAAGITAMVSLPISMNTTVGNASAAGITATITLGDPLHGFTQDQLDFLVTYMETNMTFPTAADITAAVYAGVIDGTTTFAESIRLHNAVLAGKVSGAGTGTEVFRDLADTKDRIVASVDGSGNRTAITRDAT